MTSLVQPAACRTLAACVLFAGATVWAVEHPDFSRYQVILDRAPFGATTGGADAQVQPNFATRFAFVGLVKTQGSGPLMAMVQDKEANRTHFLVEGAMITNAGVQVVRIERDPSKVVLQQGLETATLAYTPGGGGSPTTMAPQPSGPTAPTMGRRRIPFMRGGN